MKITEYCKECEIQSTFDESGYCNGCGKHADNVMARNLEPKKDADLSLDSNSNSICKNCVYSRKVASNELQEKGYIGCSLREQNIVFNENDVCTKGDLLEGWVDLRSEWNGTSSGIISNFQFITLNCQACKYFSKK